MVPAAVITLLGLVLAILGLRGRRTGDHPACRACGFDLAGVYPAAERCPECGTGLTARSVRKGARRRRPILAASGALLLLLGLTSGALLAYARATRYDLNRVKPDWWLLAEAGGSTDDAVLRELDRRLGAGDISRVAAAFLVDRALKEQADPGGDWFGRWKDVFAAAHKAGLASEGQLRAYAEHMLGLDLRHRSRIRAGSPWLVGDAIAHIRSTPGSGPAGDARLLRIRVGDQTVYEQAYDVDTIGSRTFHGRPSMDWVQVEHTLPPPAVPDGTHEVIATYAVWVDDGSTPPRRIRSEVEVRSTVEVVGRDGALVEVAPDESLRAAVESAVAPRDLRLIHADQATSTWTAVDFNSPPIDLAFDVYWREGTREWFVGRIAAPKGAVSLRQFGGWEFPMNGATGENAEVLLRPSRAAAEEATHANVDRIWGGEIVIRGREVKITDQGGKR